MSPKYLAASAIIIKPKEIRKANVKVLFKEIGLVTNTSMDSLLLEPFEFENTVKSKAITTPIAAGMASNNNNSAGISVIIIETTSNCMIKDYTSARIIPPVINEVVIGKSFTFNAKLNVAAAAETKPPKRPVNKVPHVLPIKRKAI